MKTQLCGYCFKGQLTEVGSCSSCKKTAQPVRPAEALPKGARLSDKFLIGETIGQPGGFGIVYYAWDQILERRLVIKELFPDGLVKRGANGLEVKTLRTDLEPHFNLQRTLFIDEARKLARLENVSSVVNIIEFFSQNATGYLVMVFIPGRSLVEVIKAEGQMNAGALVSRFAPLIEGLSAVHKLDILHRDIKPENILVEEGSGRLVLIDFGNALATANTSASNVEFYSVSPNFGAPEQYSNELKRMGPWTDIYSLAAVMYFCHTSVRPTDAKQRLLGVPVTPDLRALSTLPVELSKCLDMGLSLDENHRPRSCSDMLRILEPLRAKSSIHWTSLLPSNGLGKRMLEFHGRLGGATKGAKNGKLNWPAGILQWAWFFAYGNPLIGTFLGSIGVIVAALFAFPADEPFDVGIYAYLMTWLVLILPCAFYADHLIYGKLSSTVGSMQLDSPALADAARQYALKRSLPNPLMVLLSMIFPIALLFAIFIAVDAQKDVQAKIEAAISLRGLQKDIERFESANGIAPNDGDLQLPATHAHEVQSIKVIRGEIQVTLAVEEVKSQRMIWKRVPDSKGGVEWRCQTGDVPNKYVPAKCKA